MNDLRHESTSKIVGPLREAYAVFGRSIFDHEEVRESLLRLLDYALIGMKRQRDALVQVITRPEWKGGGRDAELTDEMRATICGMYESMYALRKRFRQEANKKFSTERARHRHLAQIFDLSLEQAKRLKAEGEGRTPSEWARVSTAKKTGFSEEAIRLVLRADRSSKRG